MSKQITVKGIEVEVEEGALDDFELLDDLAELQDGKGARLPSVFRRLVGDDHKRVLDELRGENGRVSVETAAEFIKDLLLRLSPNS